MVSFFVILLNEGNLGMAVKQQQTQKCHCQSANFTDISLRVWYDELYTLQKFDIDGIFCIFLLNISEYPRTNFD